MTSSVMVVHTGGNKKIEVNVIVKGADKPSQSYTLYAGQHTPDITCYDDIVVEAKEIGDFLT